jgi:NTP pyrophosphatase (non-canonical NTP hydrolase)
MTHEELVRRLLKPAEEISNEMTQAKANFLHLALGISGEAGEIVDAIKKHVIYDQPLSHANLAEELGDMEFYLEGLRQELEITREYIIMGNIHKLKQRYHSLSYSNQQAQERKDKQ